jgi:hypothetical protein
VLAHTIARAQDSAFINIDAFSANLTNSTVQLRWQASGSISDSVNFIVERSVDGLAFKPVHTFSVRELLPGNNYEFSEQLPLSDSSCYRLACTNDLGQTVFSGVQSVRYPRQARAEISIMPNPVFNNASLIINNEETGDISCTLYDLNGKYIRSYQFKKTTRYVQHILDMYSIPKGDYILSVRGNTINESKRILKQ